MTRIDFHILQGSNEQQLLEYTCRLAEKATNQGHKVMIFTDGPEVSHGLDQKLWSFRPESFVPHTLNKAESERSPVYITHLPEPGDFHDVLIATHSGPPPEFFSRFNRAIEIVLQQPERLKQSRENYTFYKSRGYAINSHKINN